MNSKVLLLALVVGCLPSCATVSSTQMEANELGSGVTYYLPKRDVKLLAERKLLKKDELTKAIAAKKTELETATKELTTATALVKQTEERLKQPSVQADAAAKASVEKDLALAKADEAIRTTKKTTAEGELEILEASRLAVEAAPAGTCAFSYTAKLELLPPTADPRFRMVADATHNVFRDDDTKLAVNADNLLTSANAVAVDRTGDIIVEVASALSGFGVDVGPETLIDDYAARPAPPDLKCEQLPTKFAYRFDPADKKQLSTLNEELVSAKFPFVIDVISDPGSNLIIEDPSSEPLVDKKMARWYVSGKAPILMNEVLAVQGSAGALFYRSPLPVTVVIRQCDKALTCGKDASIPIEAALVMLPQSGPISYIPMRSSAFVKTVDDVVFSNGTITSWSASRPSEVLEVVRLPLKIVRAGVSVIGEVFKFRVDVSDQQRGLAASQQAEIAAQTKLTLIQQCVRTAADDEDAALACFDVAE